MNIIKILTLLSSIFILSSCGMIKGHKSKSIDKTIKNINEAIPQDSVVEEFIEDVIEDTTGITVDFSPETLEQEGE